jgi:aspartyl-tRNA(Asn)/glutamyl-tRNA(Gln) amidotransferase subunit A
LGPSVRQLLDRYRDGTLRPSEAVERFRDRWRARQEIVGAFTATRWEEALREAVRADRGYRRGQPRPLAGVPVAIKDLIDTSDCVTAYGSPLFAGHRPARDAEVVGALRRAGAIVVGKTVTHEFAWGITSLSPHGTRCRNPLDPERIAGGSSGGSAAAVADGQVPAAIGTDTAGSIRIPAALCGVSGFKPSFGALDTRGCWPLAPSLDHVGVIVEDPFDAALLTAAIRGMPSASLGPGASRVAVASDLPMADQDALGAAGVELVEGAPLEADRAYMALGTIQAFEALAVHRAAGLYPARRDHYGADVRRRLDRAAEVPESAYEEALAARSDLRRHLAASFAGAEVLVTPMPSIDPPRVADFTRDDEDRFRAVLIPACATQSLHGLPSFVLSPSSDRRFSASLQITGRRGRDQLVLETAAALVRRQVGS